MKKIDSIVSKSRFDTYYQVTGQNYEKALALYEWNIKISSAFYIVIQSLEVSIRNSLHILLNIKMPDWHKEGMRYFRSLSTEQQKQIKDAIHKIKFLETRIRKRLHGLLKTKESDWCKEREYHLCSMPMKQQKQIKDAVYKLNSFETITYKKSFCKICEKNIYNIKNINGELKISDNKIISELSFGFWKIMFSKRFVVQKFWDKQSFTELFPYYHSKNFNSKVIEDIEKKLDKIRNLRNRISHHEPIFKDDLKNILNDIHLLLEWQSPEYKIWVDKLHDIDMLLYKKPI